MVSKWTRVLSFPIEKVPQGQPERIHSRFCFLPIRKSRPRLAMSLGKKMVMIYDEIIQRKAGQWDWCSPQL